MIALYLVGISQISNSQSVGLLIWTVICLLEVIALIAYGIADVQQNKPPDWIHTAICAVAVVIWVYTMGGPFTAFNLQVPWIGSLAVLVYTFFVPIFYEGPTG